MKTFRFILLTATLPQPRCFRANAPVYEVPVGSFAAAVTKPLHKGARRFFDTPHFAVGGHFYGERPQPEGDSNGFQSLF